LVIPFEIEGESKVWMFLDGKWLWAIFYILLSLGFGNLPTHLARVIPAESHLGSLEKSSFR
jgi:hypothetical protein